VINLLLTSLVVGFSLIDLRNLLPIFLTVRIRGKLYWEVFIF